MVGREVNRLAGAEERRRVIGNEAWPEGIKQREGAGGAEQIF